MRNKIPINVTIDKRLFDQIELYARERFDANFSRTVDHLLKQGFNYISSQIKNNNNNSNSNTIISSENRDSNPGEEAKEE